ncbi:MAG: NADPH-dependent FMN reductase [Planktothrix sp.]|uniref:NADPH-dependent FMN reductase n=1 Tax=Planktothrix sp. TaxID=3088171 RepID=UPI0038D40A7B
MANPPKILAFAGSAKETSLNKKLVQIAASGAKAAGAEVTYIDLKNLPMPLFDEDLEAQQGIPATVREFKDLMLAHQGLLIACPEYNSSITPLLKNVIDWASRPEPNLPGLACFNHKVAALMSASPGGFGGMRGLVHVRAILESIGVLVIPEQRSISQAIEAFNEDGTLKDSKQQQDVENLGAKVANLLIKLSA